MSGQEEHNISRIVFDIWLKKYTQKEISDFRCKKKEKKKKQTKKNYF